MKPNPKLDQKMMANGYVSVHEASKRTGISKPQIYDGINTGSIESVMVVNRKYLEIESFLEFAGDGGRVLWERYESEETQSS